MRRPSTLARDLRDAAADCELQAVQAAKRGDYRRALALQQAASKAADAARDLEGL